ncbi:MAG: nucleotidyltransferase family protein [Deltaproteobacteria bacterium]|nr:nucleotidyltransferase family protein [Deltaproteobacteria bacterium]
MILAVILAAGESSRMGQPKALLPIDGKNFIEKIVDALSQSHVARIFVVLGHNAEEMSRKIAHLPVTILINPEYKKGQLSSLQVAVNRLLEEKNCSGMLVHLVDHPYISASLVNMLIRRFEEEGRLITVPRFHGKRGHPVIFASSLFKELLNAPQEQGAKAVVNAHRDETLEVETENEGITLDIDTPELYREHVRGK